jgi:hypothetical protein
MRRLRWFEIVLLGALVLELTVSTASRRTLALADEMAANDTVGQETLRGRDVLVAGADTVVDGKSPAVISIDLGKEPVPPQANFELLLSPIAVFPNESYLIVVSIASGGAPGAKRLGTASFFPPRPGVVQAFYFSISPILAEVKAQGTSRINLSIALVSVDRSKSLEGSAVRIVGARILGV